MGTRDADRIANLPSAANRGREFESPSFAANVLEVLEVTSFITPYLLHPVHGFHTYFPSVGARAFSPETDIADLSGKIILVTGGEINAPAMPTLKSTWLTLSGNSGLGKETILQLAKHDPLKIFLASRNKSKGHAAIESIKGSLGKSGTTLDCLSLDLACFRSIRSAAAAVEASTHRLDILICNAGVMALPPAKTEQGHEIHLGINHIGHHYLTKLLLPILERTAALPGSDVRIVTISSVANERAPPVATMLDDQKLSALGAWARYGASKAANVLFAAELARRYPAITSVSVHPGIVKSDLWNTTHQNNVLIRLGLLLAGPLMFQSIPAGAHNQLWAAAAATKHELQNGAYYTTIGKVESGNTGNTQAMDAEAGKALWGWTEVEIQQA